MKKLRLVSCLFFVVSLNIAGTNNHVLTTQDTIKDNTKIINNTENNPPKKIEDYRKATDSLLIVTEITNIKSEKDLNEIKKYDKIISEENKKIEIYKSEVTNSINLLVKKLAKEKYQNKILTKKINSTNTETDEIYIKEIDSVLVKGNLLRKERYDYILIFSNGKKKRLKNKY